MGVMPNQTETTKTIPLPKLIFVQKCPQLNFILRTTTVSSNTDFRPENYIMSDLNKISEIKWLVKSK